MPTKTKTAKGWAKRPAEKGAAERFVRGGDGEVKHLHVLLPGALHRRVKLRAAEIDTDISEIVREMLEQRFPA